MQYNRESRMTTVIFVINCIDQDRLQWTSGCGVLHANLSWQRPACPNVLISIQHKE